ncbi:hypothetical protein BKA82DRAFT_4022231 [Pisolithus tinctorius]|nr:hypothetical protein BKA82DRAFT_4022231 [Pisolithus tinctorius]
MNRHFLCGVPHTVFGALSNAAGTMNVYICFPRMILRDEMTQKHAIFMRKCPPHLHAWMVWGDPSRDVTGGMHAGHQHVFWRCKEEVVWGARQVQDEWGCCGAGNTGGPTKGDIFPSLIMIEELLASHPILRIMTKCMSTITIILNFHVRESMAILQVSRVTIELQPWLIMQDWKWLAQLSSLETVVGKLFILFTCPEGKPKPMSLEDAIQSWTLNEIFRTIHACEFKPCNVEIPGSAGAGPTAGQPSQRSPWSVFWTKPGYIWEYHQVMKDRTPLEEFEVLDHLSRIFTILQIIPDVTKGSAKSPAKRVKRWFLLKYPTKIAKCTKMRCRGTTVTVLVMNLKFYKIKGISTEREQQQARRQASQVVKPRNALQMELREHVGYDELLARKTLILERQKLKEAQTKKSSKAKNAQKPPARRGKALHRVEG